MVLDLCDFYVTILLLVLACHHPTLTVGQVSPLRVNYSIRHVGVEDGLSQGSNYSILKDDQGFMWMTSYEGLNRFDGDEFKVFLENPKDSNSLVGNNTLGLCESNRFIWVGSEKCLNYYDKNNAKFKQIYTRHADHSVKHNRHYPIYADSISVIYINELEGICEYFIETNEKTIINSTFHYKRNEFLINSIVYDENDNIWIRLDVGLARFNKKNDSVDYFYGRHPQNKFGIPGFIYALYVDGKNEIILSTDRGIVLFDHVHLVDKVVVPYNDYLTPASDIAKDDLDQIWIGTNDKGLYKWDSRDSSLINFNKYGKGKLQLTNNSPSHLYYDDEGMLWVNTDPDGVCLISRDDKPFENFKEFRWKDKLIYPFGMRCFEELDNGLIVLGTQDDGIRFFNPNKGELEEQYQLKNYTENHASDLLLDSEGWLWIATYNGMYVVKDNSMVAIHLLPEPGFEQLPNRNNAWYMFEDQNKNILYGSNLGLFHIHRSTLSSTHLPVVKNNLCEFIGDDGSGNLMISQGVNGLVILPKEELYLKNGEVNKKPKFRTYFKNEFNVNSITQSSNKSIFWVSTTTGLFSIVTDSAWTDPFVEKYFGREHGMPSAFVYGSLEDTEGVLWASTNRGIVSIDPMTEKINVFSPKDGLQGHEFNTNAYYKAKDGYFYFGGVVGFNRFNPLDIEHNKIPPPDPQITSLVVNDEETNRLLSPPIASELEYKENTITFSFLSTDYRSVGRNTYRYRLKNYDDQWFMQNQVREARYVHLPSGKYTFEVQAANDNMIWNEQSTSFSFTIRPPWWRTWWFVSLTGLALVAITVSLIRQQINKIKYREETNRRLAELQLSALQSQMNPHFVFNCMNTIDGFIATNDRRKASDFIASFSKIIRKSLELSRSKLISLDEELKFIKNYINLEKQRFDLPFAIEWIFTEQAELRQRKIPPMTIQPIVENAIWHGIRPQKQGGRLSIGDGFENEQYYIFVADNGPGMTASASNNDKKSLGLKILQERLDLINRSSLSKYKMVVESGLHLGTKISIFIPAPNYKNI